GLPPLEAIACGCQVFSSVNSGLADYLDPGFNCYKIAGYSQEYDVQRILEVVNSPDRSKLPDAFLEPYRSKSLVDRLQVILTEINQFFDRVPELNANIEGLSPWRVRKLWMMKSIGKLQRRLLKSR
ncbi:MAG: glycosyltransferase family 1 protein, partial [Geitlerinemataceae cyanobacterium]